MQSMISNERGCGRRKAGGVYIEVPLSARGRPLEDFLLCPPRPTPPNEEGLIVLADSQGAVTITPRGVSLINREGTFHVVDYVGAEYYPNVADFISEARVLGISRRAELAKSDYSKLSGNSLLILIHPLAYLENHAEYRRVMSMPEERFFSCRKDYHSLVDLHEKMCCGLFWHDLKELDLHQPSVDLDRRAGMRTLACGASYFGYEKSTLIQRRSVPAIFAIFPIGRIAVVKDSSEMETHRAKLDKLQGTGLPVALVEE